MNVGSSVLTFWFLRQGYKAFKEGRATRMTAEKIRLLESIGMVWDAQRGGNRQHGRYRPINDSTSAVAHSPSVGGIETDHVVTAEEVSHADPNGKADLPPPDKLPQRGSNTPVVRVPMGVPDSSSITSRGIATSSASLPFFPPQQQYNTSMLSNQRWAAHPGTALAEAHDAISGGTTTDPSLVAALIEANVRQYAMPPSQLDLITAAAGFRDIPVSSMRSSLLGATTSASRTLALSRANPFLTSRLMAPSSNVSPLLMEQSLLGNAVSSTWGSGSGLSSIRDIASLQLLSQYITDPNRLSTTAYTTGSLLYPNYANAGLSRSGGHQGDTSMHGLGQSLLQQARLAAAGLSGPGAQMSASDTASINMIMARRALERRVYQHLTLNEGRNEDPPKTTDHADPAPNG